MYQRIEIYARSVKNFIKYIWNIKHIYKAHTLQRPRLLKDDQYSSF
jgi:hypothetical protein